MKYTINDIEKILEFKSWSSKEKENELLRIDCAMYTYLGTDSTKQDREQVKKNSRTIYRALKNINPQLSEHLMTAIDK